MGMGMGMGWMGRRKGRERKGCFGRYRLGWVLQGEEEVQLRQVLFAVAVNGAVAWRGVSVRLEATRSGSESACLVLSHTYPLTSNAYITYEETLSSASSPLLRKSMT